GGARGGGGRAVAEPPLKSRDPDGERIPAGNRGKAGAGEPSVGASQSVPRLLGLDRSGPPPAQTQGGQPLRPWTIPNAIGFARLALIPIFLVVALSSSTGTDAPRATRFPIARFGD